MLGMDVMLSCSIYYTATRQITSVFCTVLKEYYGNNMTRYSYCMHYVFPRESKWLHAPIEKEESKKWVWWI